MKVVLDSNVLLAGVATHGLCEALLALCYGRHTVVLSEYILDEVHRQYSAKFKATDEIAAKVAATLRSQSDIVHPHPVDKDACKDPDDLPVLGTALSAGADALVTGDKALLKLREFRGIPILSPRVFYEMVRETA